MTEGPDGGLIDWVEPPNDEIEEHDWVIDPQRVHQHVGHSLTVSVYGERNLAIECEDCMEIMGDIDFA